MLFFGDLEAESGINTAQMREEYQGGGLLGDERKGSGQR